MSLNTKLATAPNTSDTYILKASGTSIGNSIMYQDSGGGINVAYSGTTGGARIRITPDTPQGYIESYDSGGNFYKLVLATGGLSVRNGLSTSLLEVATNGAVTLTGALSGTSATFSGDVAVGTSIVSGTGNLQVGGSSNGSLFAQQGTDTVRMGVRASGRTGIVFDSSNATFTSRMWYIDNVGANGSLTIGRSGLDVLTLANTGAATFSSRVTADNMYINATSAPALGSPKLFVKMASANSYEGLLVASSSNNNVIAIAHTGTEGLITTNYGTSGANTPLGLGTNGSAQMYITTSGNVGIGTSSPSMPLDIVGNPSTGYTSTRPILNLQSNQAYSTAPYTGINFSAIYNSGGGATSLAFIGGGKETSGDGVYGGYLKFSTRTDGASDIAERMRITSGGYTKISNNGSYLGTTGAYHEIYQSVNSASPLIINHSGTAPIGAELSFSGADPNNATQYILGAYSSSPSFVWIYRIWSNGTVSARSDARWKKNIETTRNGYLEDLCKLRVVKYNWYNHEEDAPKELGLIAQEVEEVFPNLISYDKVTTKKQVEQEDGSFIEQEVEDGETRSIKISVLPYMLLKAIQEQQSQIEELKALIAAK